MNKKSDILRLRDMRFFGYHGAYPEEKRLGGQFRVTVELRGDFSYDNTNDDLKRSIDLAAVYRIVEEIVADKSFNLIETLAEEIADLLLGGFGVDSVTVTVVKDHPPIPGSVQSIEAVITRER